MDVLTIYVVQTIMTMLTIDDDEDQLALTMLMMDDNQQRRLTIEEIMVYKIFLKYWLQISMNNRIF